MESSQKKLEPFKITMLGPSGVGKTSLLTVMWRQMKAGLDVNQLRLEAGNPEKPGSDYETSNFLNTCEEELKQLVKRNNRWIAEGGIPGTANAKKFDFYFSNLQKISSLLLEFQDYPGGWVIGEDPQKLETGIQEREQKINRVIDYIKDANVTILAIDTPALIEKKGKYHVQINKTEIIKEILLKAYIEDLSEQPKLLIFAPVKCENYLKKANNIQQIEQSICSQYKELIDILKNPDFSNISAVITPVQTVGNVLFSYIREIEENGKVTPKFVYEKTNNFELMPVNAEQPLRYILQFALKFYIDQNCLSLDEDLKVAMNQFAAGCNLDGGFVISNGDTNSG
ncbi:hypothetical protein NIES2100_68000 [Calothrix sp. NIES-2100]|nr:hypothetical protein NIES2100_68000 [Calothrix sp. NIES-2100]